MKVRSSVIFPFILGILLPPVSLLGYLQHKTGVLGLNTNQHSGLPVPETPTRTSTILPTLTQTQTSIPTVTEKPWPTRTPTPTAAPVTSEELDRWFSQYSSVYSVDRGRLWRIAVCESRLKTNAINGEYAGLYQFSSSTWRSTRKRMNLLPDPQLRFNPEEAIKTAAFLLSTRGHDPWPNCSK